MMEAAPPSNQSDNNVNPGDEQPTGTFTNYLRNLAGQVDIEVHYALRDHCYAKPWNWKPDSLYVKPTKKLFFINKNSKITNDLEIDPVKVEPNDAENLQNFPEFANHPPCHNEELQKLLNLARPDDTDNWDENIDKTFWTPLQNRLLDKANNILNSELLSRLSRNGNPTELITKTISMKLSCKKFRQLFASTGYDWRMIQWLHSILFDNLPKDFLAIYFEIMHCLRAKIPQVVDRIISTQPRIQTKTNASINWDSIIPLLKRTYDPVSVCLNSNRPRKLPGNPILIITPSSQMSTRQVKWIASLGHLGHVVHVNANSSLGTNKVNMTTCADQLVQATRAKIQEVRNDCPGRPLILVGFNSGASMACQIAHIEHVTAVVCLGFPFCTVEGPRGTPDDILMDIRCPVMFVVGQNAMTVRIDELEDMRERMLVQTSLVVVGSADDQLRMSTWRKYNQGISQSMVDRAIIDEICDFIGAILLAPHPIPLRHPGLIAAVPKKEPRKRKGSQNLVDSNPSLVGGKKSRPGTPTVVSPLVTQGTPGNLQVVLMPQKSGNKQITTSMVTAASVKRQFETKSGNFIGEASGHQFTGQATPSDGGITLNIGSLASLGPIGPIRLAPSTSKPQKVSKTTQARMANKNTSRNPIVDQQRANYELKNITQPESQQSICDNPAHGSNQADKAPNIESNEKQGKAQLKDYDSILDIPIVFAKDDGTLTSGLEKADNESSSEQQKIQQQQRQQYHIISPKTMKNLSFFNVDPSSSSSSSTEKTFKHTRIIFTKDNNSKLPTTLNLINKKKLNNNDKSVT